MTIAVNPSTGETIYLTDEGQWAPARTAVNPSTKEMLAFDGKDWKPVPKSKGVLGYVDDAVRSIASGITFGWADEFAAKMDEVTGRGGSYEENLKREAARDKEISPWISVPGEVAGGVASAVASLPVTGPAAVASGVSRLAPWMRFGGAGGALGALQGAGTANPDERTSGAVTGGLIGAPIGIAAPHVVQGATRLGQGVVGAFSPRTQAAGDLSRAIARDGMTPDELATRSMAAAQDRPNVATLADVGGENVRGLVERVAQTPGAGRTTVVPTLTTRQQNQASRIAADLRTLTGTHQTARQAIESTMEARSQAARPLYDEAMEFDVTQAPGLASLFLETTRSGWGNVILRSPALRRNLQTEFGIRGDNLLAPGNIVNGAGDAVPPGAIIMRVIDAWKKQADDLVEEARRSGNANKARIISQMRDRVVAAADEANPAYARARDAWAGPSRYLDAVEEGRNILSPRFSAEELGARLRTMGDSEREAFRIGAVSAIQGRMGNDAARLADMTKYLRSPEMRAKIAAMMPDQEAAASWMRRLDFEVGASELTARSLGNSATARRLAESQDAESLTTDLVLSALSGSPAAGIWRKLLQAGPGRIRDTLRSRSDSALADILMRPQTPQELQDIISRVGRTGAPASELRRMLGVVGGVSAVE